MDIDKRAVDKQIDSAVSMAIPLTLTVMFGIALTGLLVLSGKIGEATELGFLTPYKSYLIIAEIVILGVFIVENGRQVIYRLALHKTSPDVAAAIRIISRISAYGVILSVVVSLLTENPAAALTMGSFAGLVVGFGSQTVMNNLIAGVFMAVARPVRIGDDVVLGSATNSGIVKNITLMHIILETEETFIKVPSGTTVNQVLQVVKPKKPVPPSEGDSDGQTE